MVVSFLFCVFFKCKWISKLHSLSQSNIMIKQCILKNSFHWKRLFITSYWCKVRFPKTFFNNRLSDWWRILCIVGSLAYHIKHLEATVVRQQYWVYCAECWLRLNICRWSVSLELKSSVFKEEAWETRRSHRYHDWIIWAHRTTVSLSIFTGIMASPSCHLVMFMWCTDHFWRNM